MVMRDRRGCEIDVLTWGALRDDRSYRVLAEARPAGVTVRTVWEGVDEYPGAMFATGVRVHPGSFITVAETATEEQALTAHERAVRAVCDDAGPGLAERLRAAFAEPA